MELPGHVGVALLVFTPVAYLAIRRGRPRRAWVGLAVVLALSVAPDVDLYLAGVAHRGVTHTAWAVLLASGVVATVAYLPSRVGGQVSPRGLEGKGTMARARARGRFGAVVGGAGVASHLLGDVVTPMGIRPFLPLSETTYTLSLVYAADPATNLGLLVAGVATFAIAVSRARLERVPTPVATETPETGDEAGKRA